MKNVFIRQSFTELTLETKPIVDSVFLEINKALKDSQAQIIGFDKALDASNFKDYFKSKYNQEFTPENFRDVRLKYLADADYFIIIRTGLSESTAFEIAYNIYGGKNIPMLFLIWKQSPIKTTLTRGLNDIAKCTYIEFDKPDNLALEIAKFLGL